MFENRLTLIICFWKRNKMRLADYLYQDFLPPQTPFIPTLAAIEELPETEPIGVVDELIQGSRIFVDNGRWNDHLTIEKVFPLKKGKELITRDIQGKLVRLIANVTKSGIEGWGTKGGKLKIYSSF